MQTIQEIFTITVFQKIEETESKLPDIGNHRCVGFYHNYYEAENAVMENFNDIHEDNFEYAIIETVEPGVKLKDINRTLFKWDGSNYSEVDIPDLLKKLSNFGIG